MMRGAVILWVGTACALGVIAFLLRALGVH